MSMILAAVLLSASQGQENIVLRHDIGTSYARNDYEAACGSVIFRVGFRNGPEGRGRVDYLLIDGRSVPNAAETLQIRAASRGIDHIAIMNCGMDPHQPILRGIMTLSEAESRVARLRPSLFFRLTRQGPGEWRMTLD